MIKDYVGSGRLYTTLGIGLVSLATAGASGTQRGRPYCWSGGKDSGADSTLQGHTRGQLQREVSNGGPGLEGFVRLVEGKDVWVAVQC